MDNAEELISLMNQTKHLLHKKVSSYLGQQDITKLHCEALCLIGKKTTMNMKEVSTELGLSMPSTTQLIDKLIEAKYVIRSQSKQDRRINNVTLSKSGKSQMCLLHEYFKKAVMEVFSQVTEKEYESLIAIHKKVIETNKTN